MFVRTKDNVYLKIRDTEYNNEHIVVGKTPVDFGTYILKKDIIKQADTIEELCDEFVIEYFDSEKLIQIRYADLEWAKKDFGNNKKGTLYGAIRVAGKGLIYVAKMNDKGELELCQN